MAVIKRTKTDGKPSYLVRIETTKDGNRRQQIIGTYPTKRAAETAERDALTKRDSGTLPERTSVTVGQALDRWLTVKKTEVTGQSYTDYEIVVRKHLKPALGDIRLRDLEAARLQDQYAAWTGDGMSARSIRGCHMRLSQALDLAVRHKLTPFNVCRDVDPPKLSRAKPKVWDTPHVVTFLGHAEKDGLHPLWHLLVLEGMRRGEALGLRWGDVDLERGRAHIRQTVIADKQAKGAPAIQGFTKTDAGSRTVRLTSETLEGLRTHRKAWAAKKVASADWRDHDLIVCTRDGAPINPNNVSRSFDRLVSEATLPDIRVHDLRHTSATMLLREGVPAKVVSERLGHATVGITLDIYSHVLPDMQDQASDALSRALATAGGSR